MHSNEKLNTTAADGLPARCSGDWIRRKHHYLDHYCGITAMAMKNRFKSRVFVDVMAGPGLCKLKDTGEELFGSPLTAMKHPFTKFVFIESDPIMAAALEKRVQAHPKAELATVISEDWTKVVTTGQLDFEGLVVAFVDPTGIAQAPWTAVERLLRGNRSIDLLTTLQYSMGITLNLYQYVDAEPEKTTALDVFLGERDWRNWQRGRSDSEFTGHVLNRYLEKFGDLGFQSSRQITVGARDSAFRYRLALLSRHPKADEFWQKIITVDESGQRELL